jgi:hypothetical protein
MVAVLARVAIAQPEAAAVQRRGGERLRLAILPGELLAVDQVEGEVEQVEGTQASELRQPEVVPLVEAGEAVGLPPRRRGAEIGADQAVPVAGVEREPVDVDQETREGAQEAEGQESAERGGGRGPEGEAQIAAWIVADG